MPLLLLLLNPTFNYMNCMDVFSFQTTLGDVLDFLKESSQYQMMNPGVTTTTESGNKTLYMPGIAALENATKENLEKTLIGKLLFQSIRLIQ